MTATSPTPMTQDERDEHLESASEYRASAQQKIRDLEHWPLIGDQELETRIAGIAEAVRRAQAHARHACSNRAPLGGGA